MYVKSEGEIFLITAKFHLKLSLKKQLISLLNASIEEARAGQFGNGFAVVAQEMSKLGESAKENAIKIHSLISEAVKNAGEGMNAMAISSMSFSKINSSVKKSIQMVEKISSLSEDQLQAGYAVKNNFELIAKIAAEIKNSTYEQALTLSEFSNSVMKLSQNTQTTSINSQNIDKLAGELSEQSVVLHREIGFFVV